MRRSGALLSCVWLLAMAAAEAIAAPAATLTPDGRRLLVSRDAAGLRWLVAFDMHSGAVSGNVFDPAGGEPRFVRCALTGARGDDLVFQCSGATGCAGADCVREWDEIGGEVTVPVAYFRAGTFEQRTEALLGEWLGGFFANFVEIVERDGVPALRGLRTQANGEVYAKVVGDGVAGFKYELLDDSASTPTCTLYRFNQIAPGYLAGVSFRVTRSADGACSTAAPELAGWFVSYRYPSP